MEGDRLVVVNYLQNKGYADAQVSILVSEADQDNRIILEFVVERGTLYTAGRLTFSAHTLFTTEQIDQVFAIRRGDQFSPEAVREASRNITDLYGGQGYIDAVVQFDMDEFPFIGDVPITNLAETIASFTVVPEPTTALLVAIGLAVLAVRRKRRLP